MVQRRDDEEMAEVLGLAHSYRSPSEQKVRKNTVTPDMARDTIRITHQYDIGNQDVFVTRKSGDVDPLRAALYCQFKSEEWFDQASALTNLGIASMLVMHFGFRQAAATEDCQTIDMYREREAACGPRYGELMADTSLHRDGLRDSMTNFFD